MKDEIVNLAALESAAQRFFGAAPFDHCVIPDFFAPDVARTLEGEFPVYDAPIWHEYDNALEKKRTSNNWNVFPPATYRVLSHLNSDAFVARLSELFGIRLYADNGLNGGGWHLHGPGGKLNTHLDYSLHPKLGLQRKLNLIVYLNSAWREEWGGSLGLWAQAGEGDDARPGALVQTVAPLFNRAVLFDTTQNSWHGLPEPITCPANETRRSLAVYYLCDPPAEVNTRGKALFAPTKEQEGDPEVAALIRARASVTEAAKVYRN